MATKMVATWRVDSFETFEETALPPQEAFY